MDLTSKALLYDLASGALITIGVLVVVWQGFVTYRAKANIARETAYQKLSERAIEAEQKSADQQQKIAESLDDIQSRLASIEKMLRDVE